MQQHNDSAATSGQNSWLNRWHATPLYLRILGAVVLGVLIGVLLGVNAAPLEVPAKLVLRILGALAPPLILLAIVQALMRTQVAGHKTLRLAGLLLLNTLVAIGIGLAVANVIQPGRWRELPPPVEKEAGEVNPNPLMRILEGVPKSLLGPLGDEGNVLSVIFLTQAVQWQSGQDILWYGLAIGAVIAGVSFFLYQETQRHKQE